MRTLNDNDLNEPIRKQQEINKESLDIIATFSHQSEVQVQEKDSKQVKKLEKMNTVRKSEGYKNFINKFKK